jgi:hypothetical protein
MEIFNDHQEALNYEYKHFMTKSANERAIDLNYVCGLRAFTSQTQCSMENVNVSLCFWKPLEPRDSKIFLSCDISFLNPTHTLTKAQ